MTLADQAKGATEKSAVSGSQSDMTGQNEPQASQAATEKTDVEKIDVAAVNKKEQRSFYKKRVKIHPKRASGYFRQLKWVVMAITLSIYYLTPWLRWDRGPGMPDQAVLIDLPGRRFYFFFIEIWPQEVYYITGLLILAALGLFLVTSVMGRAWCGYSCPQTVWTDLFLVVERFIEGDRNARIKLDRAPMSASKLAKRVSKHTIWLLIGVATGGAWVFYFADAPTLLVDLFTLKAAPVAYISVAVLTATTYLFGGLAREQVCTYMCPWPRIQAAMQDEDSFIVTYHEARGEPRGPHKKGEAWEGRGHCIDCNQCVAVCPMGIDIRDGQQLECISCALCIDACDEVMDRVGLPKGLVSYDTLSNQARKAEGKPEKYRIIRPRTVVYSALILLVGAIMVYGLLTRSELDVNVLRDRNPLFVKLSDGSIRNGYTVRILNKLHEERIYGLAVKGLEGATLSVVGSVGDFPDLSVPADKSRSFKVFVSAPEGQVKETVQGIDFVVTDLDRGTTASTASSFRGPEK